jgi:hypothetical protein
MKIFVTGIFILEFITLEVEPTISIYDLKIKLKELSTFQLVFRPILCRLVCEGK